MNKLAYCLLLPAVLFFGLPTAGAVVHIKSENAVHAVERSEAEVLSGKELRKYRRAERKAKKQEIRQAIRDWKKEGASDTDTLLLVIIAILLPPLAMGIYEGGLTNRFWISLLLTLLFYLPGLIYTLIVILE